MTMCILLIENSDLSKTKSLGPRLEKYGHTICAAHTPTAAAAEVTSRWPNLIVFNLDNSQMPLASFREAIDEINLNIPYLIVGTAGHNLPVGEEPNLTSVSSVELQPLTEAVDKAVAHQIDRFIRLPNLVVDCHQQQILRNAERHSLTPKEFKLLCLFINNSDQVLSRKAIMQEVWETDYMGDTRTLDVHIRWLREKIEEKPSQPRRLITVRGVGYHFVTEIK